MRVYISGPIRGTGDYVQRFEDAEYELREHGFKPINPVKADVIDITKLGLVEVTRKKVKKSLRDSLKMNV